MPGPEFRDTFYQGMGASHVYKTGTSNSTAAEVLAAVTGKRYRLKAFRFLWMTDFSTPADTAINLAWLADGTTAILGLAMCGGLDAASVAAPTLAGNGQMVVLPSLGVTGTAATAVNIDFTATQAGLSYQLDLWYDVIV